MVSGMHFGVPGQSLGQTSPIKDHRLGFVFPQLIQEWKTLQKDFPKPIAILTIGNILNWKEVETWARKTKRIK